jgi:WD40 repeat protein
MCEMFSLFLFSGQDGTVRIWNVGNGASKCQPYLQQTCVFNNGNDVPGRDLECKLLEHVVWNCTGKLIAGAVDNMVTIWAVIGGSLRLLFRH